MEFKFQLDDFKYRTLFHELGHAVEQINRGHKTHPNYVGYSSNSWEVESFCDAFGCALCKGAGYNLSPSIEKLKLSTRAYSKILRVSRTSDSNLQHGS